MDPRKNRTDPQPSRQDHLFGWVEGLRPVPPLFCDDPATDILYEIEGILPPRKRDPSHPLWRPGR